MATVEKPADIEQSVEAQVFKMFRNVSNYLGMFTMNVDGVITIISGDFTREVAETQGMYILDIVNDVKGIIDANQSLSAPFNTQPEKFKRIVLNYGTYSLSVIISNNTIYVAKFASSA